MRLANSAVRAGIEITTTVGRFSTGSIRTFKGLPSGSQKILVILHSPKLIEDQLQLKLTLLSGVFVCYCGIDILCDKVTGQIRAAWIRRINWELDLINKLKIITRHYGI